MSVPGEEMPLATPGRVRARVNHDPPAAFACVVLACPPLTPNHPSHHHHQVFEYLSTDLKKWMDRGGKGPAYPLQLGTVKNLMYQLVKGLAYCHKHGILHRRVVPLGLAHSARVPGARAVGTGGEGAKTRDDKQPSSLPLPAAASPLAFTHA